jgi:two-component sensor histidine kinase
MTELQNLQNRNLAAQTSLNSKLAAAGFEITDAGSILRSVLAGSGDCIKILDLDGGLQFMSEGGKRVMEVDDFSKLKDCPWPAFWEGAGNASAIEALASARAGNTATFSGAATTAKGTPRYWEVTVAPITDAQGRPQQILSISRDVTRYCEAIKNQKFQSDELARRAKNTFAIAIAITNQTLLGIDPAGERATLNSRLAALNDAQNTLIQGKLHAAPIMTVVQASLSPYRIAQDQFIISGPAIELHAKQALALALALHELATNAIKYGALSSDKGTVEVTWSIVETARPAPAHFHGSPFYFQWLESGGPPVSDPKRSGFGSRLIKGLLTNDFGGTVNLTYERSGVQCDLVTLLDSTNKSDPF